MHRIAMPPAAECRCVVTWFNGGTQWDIPFSQLSPPMMILIIVQVEEEEEVEEVCREKTLSELVTSCHQFPYVIAVLNSVNDVNEVHTGKHSKNFFFAFW